MAEEEKKDNFLLIVGVIAAIAITGVVLLKKRETEHLKQAGPTSVEQEAQVLQKANRPKTVMVE